MRSYLPIRGCSFVIAALLLLVVVGGSAMETLLGVDASDTRQRVIARIPIGSRLSDAQATMELNGFRCQQMKGARFVADNPAGGPQTQHGPGDFLWCDSGERTAGRPITKRWQVMFTHNNEVVTEVYVAVGLTGP